MSSPNNREISCTEIHAKLGAGEEVLLLDCRERDEYDLVRIPQSHLLPMSELPLRINEIEAHRDREIVVLCHHGVRSLHVAMWLSQQGFANVRSLSGGIDRWAVEIDPTLPRY